MTVFPESFSLLAVHSLCQQVTSSSTMLLGNANECGIRRWPLSISASCPVFPNPGVSTALRLIPCLPLLLDKLLEGPCLVILGVRDIAEVQGVTPSHVFLFSDILE